jgi:hypothetical protein
MALLLAACSGAEQSGSGSESPTTQDASESTDAAQDERAPAPPGITPTAAPGVAFNYRYAFRLPGARISAVQEQHAAACEKLGVSRCRITGLHYSQDGPDRIEAQLAFKLDPALARAFGREGIEAVTRAEGELLSADIQGTDVGAQIDEGARSGGQIADDLARIEQQLARPGLSGRERAELQQQAQALRDTARANEAQQTDRRAQLATTPMVFDYQAGDTGGRIAQAARNAARTFEASLAALIVIALTLLPWIVLALLLWLAWRWVNSRFLGGAPLRPRLRESPPPEA